MTGRRQSSCPERPDGCPKRIGTRKLKCRSRVAQCIETVNTFLSGNENYCELPDINSETEVSSSGESELSPRPIRKAILNQKVEARPCQHFMTSKCWLEGYCEFSHSMAPTLQVAVEPKQSAVMTEGDLQCLRIRKWFWLEKVKGYHEMNQWVAFPESATPHLENSVNRQLMTFSLNQTPRSVQVLTITQTACWVVVLNDGSTSYSPLPFACTETLEFVYSRTCDTRCSILWNRVRYLVDFQSMEMKSSAGSSIYCLVRQPATLRLSCPPSSVEGVPILERVLSLSDKSGVRLLMLDNNDKPIKPQQVTYELPCTISVDNWSISPSSDCAFESSPHRKKCEDTSIAHTTLAKHHCTVWNCYLTRAQKSRNRLVRERSALHCWRNIHSANNFTRSVQRQPCADEYISCCSWKDPLGVFKIQKGSEEYNQVTSYIDVDFDAVTVERIENKELWELYSSIRQNNTNGNGDVITENILFTPVDESQLPQIINSGFNSGRKTIGTTTGSGPCGNARHFYVASSTARSPDSKSISSILILSLVCTGSSCFAPDPNAVAPPFDPLTSSFFHSTCDTYDSQQSTKFAVFEGSLSAPLYIIRYPESVR